MLEDVRTELRRESLLRLQSRRDLESAIRSLDLERVTAILVFVHSEGIRSDPLVYLDSPFNFKGGSKSRFSDASPEMRVFYSALEHDTAIEEQRYHLSKRVENGEVPEEFTAYYTEVRCRYEGPTKDLVPHAERFPCLSNPDPASYDQCIGIAREAIAEQVAALLTPSARRAGGICAPVFQRNALSSPQLAGTFALTRVGQTDQIEVRAV